ncbi:MAG: ABC transporter ATP-binding protein [Candidatus Pacebacteria bacterium]|nr:ABC transporter ATP-binding protein [Candidatus Paceibacterota bacterium]
MAIQYPKVKGKDIFKAFWKAMRFHIPSLVFAFIGVFLSGTVQVFAPLYYKKFIDIIATSPDRLASVPTLIHILLIILAINIGNWIGYRLSGFAGGYNEIRVMARLRQNSFDYLSKHSYGFFSDNFVGSIVQRVNRMARAYERISDSIFFDVSPLVLRLTGSVIVLWFLQPVFSVILLIWAVLFCIAQYIISVIKFPYDVKSAGKDSQTTGYLADTLTNHNTVQLFNSYKRESAGFWKILTEWRDVMWKVWNISLISDAIQSAFIFIAEFAIFYWGIINWSQGLMTIGMFTLLQLYFLDVSEKLWEVSRVIRNLYQAYADSKEMVEILMLPHEIKDIPTAKPLPKKVSGEIIFEDVTFSFQETREVLSHLSLMINAGEKVALVGPSGAGKSTFVRLLLRLYELSGGKIKIDGETIKDATLESLRHNISFVPQDPILFHRSLKENIRYGREDATEAEILEAAKLAHCDEFIQSLPKGYETLVGERGIKLSGGERQRIAIARAILKNAPILVLDEATSSLDSESEALIQDALTKLMEGKTVIVIAHRLSTIRKMDRILVLEDGKIVEEGTHDALTTTEGSLYKKLWTLQAGGFLLQEK